MVKKRRMFDIEMPEESAAAADTGETFPAGKDAPQRRRGPMAAAIRETADSVRDRAATEAAIRAENDALAHEHMRLKRLGLVVDLIPLDRIATSKLIRDRQSGPDPEIDDLKDSIRSLGLSNPIRVEEAGEGGYELVQGSRRLAAYRALLQETGDVERWSAIPAAIWDRGETLDTLYRKMVDENLVRRDISFFEMARLALDYAADPGTAGTDPDRAVATLFKSAGYQKRSYIRAFIKLVDRLGADLRFGSDIPRALGLALVARMEEVPDTPAAIIAALPGVENRSQADELEVLRCFAGQGKRVPDTSPVRSRGTGGDAARTSFHVERPGGRARCTATDGRLEIRFGRDFAAVDRHRLEAAVRRLLGDLD